MVGLTEDCLDWYNDGWSVILDGIHGLLVSLNTSSWFAHSEEGTGEEELGMVVRETTPSEGASLLDNRGVGYDDWDNGLIVGVSSRCNIWVIFCNAFIVELCASGNNELLSSKDACGIGILRGIIVAAFVVISRWVLGIQQLMHL